MPRPEGPMMAVPIEHRTVELDVVSPPPAGANGFFVDHAAFDRLYDEALKIGFDWVDAEMLHVDYPHLTAQEIGTVLGQIDVESYDLAISRDHRRDVLDDTVARCGAVPYPDDGEGA